MDELNEKIAFYCDLIGRGAKTLGEWNELVNYTDSQKRVIVHSLGVISELLGTLHKLEAPFKEPIQNRLIAESN